MTNDHDCEPGIIFEVGDTKTFAGRIMEVLKCENLSALTIQITSNKGWVVFSNIQGVSDHTGSYSYNTKLGSLPDEFGGLQKLESLQLSYLGIEGLPDSISQLKHLKSLDISFNPIHLSQELDKILKLNNLEYLKIYGCIFKNQDLETIRTVRPDLKILYSEKHMLEELDGK